MFQIDAAFAGDLDGLREMFFDTFLLFFEIKILVLRRHVAALAGRRLDKSFLRKLVVGFLHRQHADVQRFRQTADRRQRFAGWSSPLMICALIWVTICS